MAGRRLPLLNATEPFCSRFDVEDVGSPQPPPGGGLALCVESTSQEVGGPQPPAAEARSSLASLASFAGCDPKIRTQLILNSEFAPGTGAATRSRLRAEGCNLALLESRPVRSAAGLPYTESTSQEVGGPQPPSGGGPQFVPEHASTPQAAARAGMYTR